MSSLIANNVKTNMGLVLFLLCGQYTMLYVTVSSLYNNNYMFVILLYTSIPLSTNNYSLDLYNGNLQTTTFLQLHTSPSELLLTIVWLVLPFYSPTLLEAEDLFYRLLENSFATLVVCAFAYLFILYALMLVVVGLLG